MTDVQDEQMMQTLRSPAAARVYRGLRAQTWLSHFLESSNDVFRRLGALMLIEEILCAVSPKLAEKHRNGLLERRRGRPATFRFEGATAPCVVCTRPTKLKSNGTFRSHGMPRCLGSGAPS